MNSCLTCTLATFALHRDVYVGTHSGPLPSYLNKARGPRPRRIVYQRGERKMLDDAPVRVNPTSYSHANVENHVVLNCTTVTHTREKMRNGRTRVPKDGFIQLFVLFISSAQLSYRITEALEFEANWK